MVTHEGETKKLSWPPNNSTSAEISLLKKMVAERFSLSVKPEALNFRVTSYSASLVASDEQLDEKLLERISTNDGSLLEDLATA